MIGDFNSDRQEVWYLETSTLTVAVSKTLALPNRSTTDVRKLDTVCQIDSVYYTSFAEHLHQKAIATQC